MYSIYFLFSVIVILIITLVIQIRGKVTVLPAVLLTVLIIYFLLNPKQCIDASLRGAELFVQAVLPTLLPFMVVCNLLISYEGITLYGKLFSHIICTPFKLSKNASFPIIAGIICGNPIGSKYSSDLYKQGYLEFNEYSRLIILSSNTGPLFLVGSVGSVMLQNKNYGYFLLGVNYISMILIGLMTMGDKSCHNKKNDSKPAVKAGFGTIFKDALENAVMNTLNISGYVIIFSVLISIVRDSYFFNSFSSSISSLLNIPDEALKGGLLGLIEITNGCKIISSSSLCITVKLCILCFLTSFCGLSVLAQISSFCSRHKVNLKKYLMYKFIQGIMAGTIAFIFLST